MCWEEGFPRRLAWLCCPLDRTAERRRAQPSDAAGPGFQPWARPLLLCDTEQWLNLTEPLSQEIEGKQ